MLKPKFALLGISVLLLGALFVLVAEDRSQAFFVTLRRKPSEAATRGKIVQPA